MPSKPLFEPYFADFASAFCAGYIACKDGLKDSEGENFLRAVMEAWMKTPYSQISDN